MENEMQKDLCVYCGCNADTKDHVVPWSYEHSKKRKGGKYRETNKKNLVPACKECNSLVSDKVFDTLEEKREWIHYKLRLKYKRILTIPVWEKEEIKTMALRFQKSIKWKMLAKKWIEARLDYPNTRIDLMIPPKRVIRLLSELL